MVIKPDAVQAGRVEEILERVQAEGIEVLACEEHLFTKEEAVEFYKQHEESVSISLHHITQFTQVLKIVGPF